MYTKSGNPTLVIGVIGSEQLWMASLRLWLGKTSDIAVIPISEQDHPKGLRAFNDDVKASSVSLCSVAAD